MDTRSRSLLLPGLLGAFCLGACAGSTSTASQPGQALDIQLRGKPLAHANPRARDVRFFLVEAAPGARPTVKACARFVPTGSRIKQDTCRNAVDPTHPAAQIATALEQVAQASLDRSLAKGPLPLAKDGETPVLDVTPEHDEAIAQLEANFTNAVSGSTRAWRALGPDGFREEVEN